MWGWNRRRDSKEEKGVATDIYGAVGKLETRQARPGVSAGGERQGRARGSEKRR